MSEHEGVIQFQLSYTKGPPEPVDGLDELVAWRRLLRRLGLLGQDPARYGGFGFGNVSLRLPPQARRADQPPFIISGSQTGHFVELGPEHFALVTGWDIDHNRVEARGPTRPSSETLTHAAIYQADDDVRCVMHVHSPEIWRWTQQLGIPSTPKAASFGTPEMARAVVRLIVERAGDAARIVAMGGHEDGMVGFGGSADEAGLTICKALADSFRLEAK